MRIDPKKHNKSIRRRAKAIVQKTKDIPSGYEVLSHPVMELVDILNAISSKIETDVKQVTWNSMSTAYNKTKDLLESQSSDKDLSKILNEVRLFFEETAKHAGLGDFESFYIAYFFILKTLKQIQPIERYVSDITPPEEKFKFDENL